MGSTPPRPCCTVRRDNHQRGHDVDEETAGNMMNSSIHVFDLVATDEEAAADFPCACLISMPIRRASRRCWRFTVVSPSLRLLISSGVRLTRRLAEPPPASILELLAPPIFNAPQVVCPRASGGCAWISRARAAKVGRRGAAAKAVHVHIRNAGLRWSQLFLHRGQNVALA